MLKKKILILFIVYFALTNTFFATSITKVSALTQATYYISTTGNDNNPGTLSQPFLTIQKARDVARTINGNMSGDIIINLLDGRYDLSSTLQLESQDSGTNGYKIIYQAYSGSSPVISGGIAVTGWTVYDSNISIYRAYVGTSINTRQLYVNGTSATRARSTDGMGWVKSGTGYNNANIASWGNRSDIEVVSRVDWREYRGQLQSVSGTHAVMKQPFWDNACQGGTYAIGNPNWIENAYELLDLQGEWYLDRTTGYLYYKPRTGENMNTAIVMLPKLEKLITGASVQNISFYGIRFSYATWLEPSSSDGYCDSQSGVHVLGVGPNESKSIAGNVEFSASSNLRFEGNTFENLGGTALYLKRGCKSNIVFNNILQNISGHGIQIGQTDDYDSHANSTDLVLDNTIDNNLITAIGSDYHDSLGIFSAWAQHTVIRHNEIHDVPYGGISLGWGWGIFDDDVISFPLSSMGYTTPTVLKNCVVESNYLYRVMQTLTDGSGIYNLSKHPGLKIKYNFVRDINHDFSAYYMDDGSRYVEMSYNSAYAITASNLNNHHSQTQAQINYPPTYTVQRNDFIYDKGIDNYIHDNTWATNGWDSVPGYIRDFVGRNGVLNSVSPLPSQNLSTGKAMSGSSQWSTDFTYTKSNDDNANTGWSPLSPTQDPRPYLQIDLGNSFFIGQITLTARQDADQPETRRNFEIRASNMSDFSSYTVLGSQGNDSFAHMGTWSAYTSDRNKYRYIRAVKTVNEYFFIAELTLYGRPAQNIAICMEATGSSRYDSSYPYGNGVDGDINKGWSPLNPAQDPRSYLKVDLGASYRLSNIQFVARQNLDQPETRRNFEIRASNTSDFSSYTVLGSQGNQSFANMGTWAINITDTNTYRYIQIIKTYDEYFFIAELRVFD